MSSFSLPFTYDKTYLVIPNPGTADNLNFQIKKVLQPFSLGLWGLVLAVIASAALLSVWFTDNENINAERERRRRARGTRPSIRRKRLSMAVYGRLAFDQCLQKGLVSTKETVWCILYLVNTPNAYKLISFLFDSSFVVPGSSKMKNQAFLQSCSCLGLDFLFSLQSRRK